MYKSANKLTLVVTIIAFMCHSIVYIQLDYGMLYSVITHDWLNMARLIQPYVTQCQV